MRWFLVLLLGLSVIGIEQSKPIKAEEQVTYKWRFPKNMYA